MEPMVEKHINSVSDEELRPTYIHPLVQERRAFKKTLAGKLTMAPTPNQALIGCGIWAVVLTVFAMQSGSTFTPFAVLFMLSGLVFWTIIEYIGHRFFFHDYHNLPVSKGAKQGFEALHVPHHYEELDGINAGPLFFVPLGTLFMTFFLFISKWAFSSYAPGQCIMVGFLVGFIAYEWFHYQLHLGTVDSSYLRFLRSFHKLHHRKNWRTNYGITNPCWDFILGTFKQPSSAANNTNARGDHEFPDIKVPF